MGIHISVGLGMLRKERQAQAKVKMWYILCVQKAVRGWGEHAAELETLSVGGKLTVRTIFNFHSTTMY